MHNTSIVELISVVMPAHNSGRYIQEALESIKGQSWKTWELLLTFDGNDAEAEEIAGTFKRHVQQTVKLVHNSTAQGPSRARNLAMAHGRGSHFAFLDADDIWLPHHLEQLTNCVLEHDADFVHAYAQVFTADARGGKKWLDSGSNQHFERTEDLFARNRINPSSAMISARLHRSVGDFDERLRGVEDLDYWIRCYQKGFYPHSTKKVSYLYRRSATALSAQAGDMAVACGALFRKHLDSGLMPRRTLLARAQSQYLAAARLYRRDRPFSALKALCNAAKLAILFSLSARVPATAPANKDS